MVSPLQLAHLSLFPTTSRRSNPQSSTPNLLYFPSAVLDNFSIATTGATGNKVFTDLTPGTYDLAENVPTGWDLTGSSCDNGKTLPDVALAAGDDVTCTFNNAKRGGIVVRKMTQPSGSPQSFDFTLTGGPSAVNESFQLRDGESKVVVDLEPGSGYNMGETVPAGWTAGPAVCDDGSVPTNIQIDPGEIVTCTFINIEDVSLPWAS